MKFTLAIITLFFSIVTKAQNLNSFSAKMRPDSLCYLSINNGKAYTKEAAATVKTVLDLGIFETKSDKSSIIEWYNLKPDNEKVPEALCGTKTKVAAISFDREQFDKCKTAADLKRMTGYISTNSLSHFGVVRNSNDYYQRCFLIEREDGKRGLIFVTAAGNNWKVEVKSE